MQPRKTYMDSQFSRRAYTLLPGDLQIINNDSMMVTVLGSCVSVYLVDSQKKIAGLNHYLLPQSATRQPESKLGRYGDTSLSLLLENMLKAGARKQFIQAKIFGGARVIDASIDIGKRNIEMAEMFLEQNNIPVNARSTGGENAIKLYALADSDVVYIRKVAESQSKSVCLDQLKLSRQLDDNLSRPTTSSLTGTGI